MNPTSGVRIQPSELAGPASFAEGVREGVFRAASEVSTFFSIDCESGRRTHKRDEHTCGNLGKLSPACRSS